MVSSKGLSGLEPIGPEAFCNIAGLVPSENLIYWHSRSRGESAHAIVEVCASGVERKTESVLPGV
jgi:hypothetical protein